MDLIFTQSEKGSWVAEFEATADFNLHIERDKGGNLMLYQRTNGGGWDIVNDFANPRFGAIDYDCAALIYPKFIKVVSEVEPTYAAITTDGEVTEIKSQDKTVEITANGTTEVTPDAGFAYLNKVNVKVDVSTSGEGGGGSASAMEYLDLTNASAEVIEMCFLFSFLANYAINGVKAITTATYAFAIGGNNLTLNAVAVDLNAKIYNAPSQIFLPLRDIYTEMGIDIDAIPRITEEEFYTL